MLPPSTPLLPLLNVVQIHDQTKNDSVEVLHALRVKDHGWTRRLAEEMLIVDVHHDQFAVLVVQLVGQFTNEGRIVGSRVE